MKYAQPISQAQFVDALMARGRALPGVRSIAVSTGLPFIDAGDVGIHFDRPPDAAVTGTIANY